MDLRLYGLVLTADGASETASEYDTKQLKQNNCILLHFVDGLLMDRVVMFSSYKAKNFYLHYSYSYANAAEYQGGVLEVLDEFVEAALLVEVVGQRSAGRGHAAGDLLTRAAGRRHRDVVGFPVIGAVDTAAFELEKIFI